MITEQIKNIKTGDYVQLFAIVDMSISCTAWDNRRHATFDELRQAGIEFNTHGSNASAERWVLNLYMSNKVKEILEKAPVQFDVENHFPGLF